jgi:hypothetical protein
MSNSESRATVGRSLAMYLVVAAVIVMFGAAAYTVSKKATSALGGPTGPPGLTSRSKTETVRSKPGVQPANWNAASMAELPEPGRANDVARERELLGDEIMRDENVEWAVKAYESALAAAEVAATKGRSEEHPMAKILTARLRQKIASGLARYGDPGAAVEALEKALDAGLDPAALDRAEFERVRAAEPDRFEALRDRARQAK